MPLYLKTRKIKISDIIILILFFAYFLASFLQEYISSYGINSRVFAIVLLLAILIYGLHRVKRFDKINTTCKLLLCWFALKFLSLLWGYSDIVGRSVVKAHFFTHILMISLLIAISFFSIPNYLIKRVLSCYYLVSIIMCILQIVYHDAYEGIDVRQVITINGAQDDPNHIGAILCVAFCFSVYYTFVKKQYKNIIFVIISVVAILYTASRGALITILAVVFTFILCFVFQSNGRYGKTTLMVIVIALLFLLIWKLVMHWLPINIFQRLFVNDYGDGSGRLIFWNEAIKLFSKKPLLGYGWGGTYVRVHNTFISMLLDVGIIGTLLFSAAYISLLFQRIKKHDVLSAMLIVSAVVSSFFIEAITLRFFWNAIFIALMLRKSNNFFDIE